MDEDEFFDVIDSHPMTDDEAHKRLNDIQPSKLPQYDQYLRGMDGLVSADPSWLLDYEDYGKAWCDFANRHMSGGMKWTAERRKELVHLEGYFESTAVNWLGG
jgi:hypothetical protein